MTDRFNKIGLWGRLTESNVAGPARQISTHLENKGVEVFVAPHANSSNELNDIPQLGDEELGGTLDLLIAIGGDGTLLRAARSVAGKNVPLIGINRGRLGFLTDISPDHMLAAIDAILAGDYLAEERQMLEAQIVNGNNPGEKMFALNDVVVQHGGIGHMLDFITTVDGSYVNTHVGNGLIVATTTGSTAYALSCGGPIIQPNVDALVLVPICPHTLSDRPLVLQSSSTIDVRIESRQSFKAEVACDGELLGTVSANESLHIITADKTTSLLHPTDYNYYELLRSKLNWGRANRAGQRS